MVWRGDETNDRHSGLVLTEGERVTGQEGRIRPGVGMCMTAHRPDRSTDRSPHTNIFKEPPDITHSMVLAGNYTRAVAAWHG